MQELSRRNFLQLGAAAPLLPLVVISPSSLFGQAHQTGKRQVGDTPKVHFIGDGLMFSPSEYAAILSEITADDPNIGDIYGSGGAVARLEAAFAEITGKEKAVFLPSGTMANQLAIKLLAGDRSKVFVQEQSHVYRDEADAAQTIHGKRLMPLAPDRGNFTLEDLEAAVDFYRQREVFEAGIGAISIENTVRRQYEEIFDLEEIRRIAAFAKKNGIGMHLDGARLYMASAYSGIPVREYASHFDTVYISLYKYFGAGAGAVLCGSEKLISKVPHLIKVYGGNMYQNWYNAAVALRLLEGFEQRFERAKKKAEELFTSLNKLEGIRVDRFNQGSNVFKLFLTDGDASKFRETLANKHSIALRPETSAGFIPLKVNESLLNLSNEELALAFENAYKTSR